MALGDVILPPWAKGDPREFVRAHREVSLVEIISNDVDKYSDKTDH